ncbi:MAG: hypothetical protein ACM3Y8_13320 [Byssovorax cruenta]|jgi:hypothetical protein
MSTPELRDAFENELRRVLIQNHVNFPDWYSTLGPHARQVVDNIVEEDVTPELIAFAQEAPEEEWNAFQFLVMIASGNPSPNVAIALTNFALGDILTEVREFRTIEK